MKYMGSKRAMLRNGLGTLLERELVGAKRFVDLFAGSAAVTSHVAQKFDIPVLAYDLQVYSVVLANAIVQRRRKLDWKKVWHDWHRRAKSRVRKVGRLPHCALRLTRADVLKYRAWCGRLTEFPITVAYGGHYFSPLQAVWIDALRSTLPKSKAARSAALGALIQAASQCAASPGHTAQPFQPTKTATRFLKEAWEISLPVRTKLALAAISITTAKKLGTAKTADANRAARSLKRSDLIFIDPPYTGVHYSRFYHVLESIARGECGPVSGVGRYPHGSQRPRSRFSVQTEARAALDDLLRTIAERGSKVILTFPNHKCSNGLSGYAVQQIAARHFTVTRKSVASRFSSLGGTSDGQGGARGRAARRHARELVLTLVKAT
jgi:adenine-specific DNA-methyltransferase